MEKLKTSACIVAYGGYEEVVRAASSVLSYTKQTDASPDETGKKLANTPFEGSVKVVCRETNGGFGTGHNTVLSQLNSKYHAVVNPDITLDTDAISALCFWMEEHPDVVMATPRLRFPDGREQYTAKRVPTMMALLARQLPLPFLKSVENHYLMLDEDLTCPHEIDFCTGSFFVIRTDVFQKMGGFDESYFMYVEDADITRKAQQYGKVMYVPITYVYHAWHRDANKKWRNFWMQIRSMFHYWHKWGFRFF